jgi:hypothetical protein
MIKKLRDLFEGGFDVETACLTVATDLTEYITCYKTWQAWEAEWEA